MEEQNQTEPLNLLLSRDELVFVLQWLRSETIPGLDEDAAGPQNEDERRLANLVAGRSLRARQMVRFEDDGQLKIHPALLTAVGVCAYASSSLFVYHWPNREQFPVRYFGHMRGEDVVLHSRPEGDLHLFTILPSKEMLKDQIFELCQLGAETTDPDLSFEVPSHSFVQVRELAYAANGDGATKVLVDQSVPEATAERFVKTLTSDHNVSILQTLRQVEDTSVVRQDLTIMQNSDTPWVMKPISGSGNDVTLSIETTTDAELRSMLTQQL